MIDPLFVHWHVDPVIFSIGPLEIRWYSLLFVSGFILGWYLFKWFFKREGKPVDKLLDPLLFTLMIATIVGSRLGHCIFYQPDYYFGSWQGFLEIFQPWKGGLASHGGTIMIVFAMWWYVSHYGKKYNFDYLWILDRLAITVAFAGCFIRVGNLFNSEIYGDVTNLPWGFIFDLRGETEPKHPTQIYEALTYLLLGLGLLASYKWRLDKTYRGVYVGWFFVVCFGSRMLIEIIKEPQVEFEASMALDMGQILSIPCVLFGIALLVFAYTKKLPARMPEPQAAPRKKEPTHYAKSLRDN